MPKDDLAIRSFGDLFKTEARSIDEIKHTSRASSENWFHISGGGHAKEPWVARCSRDRFGLALSGGGIRSATFNLGIFQALARLGLLSKIDYLSTVSGGGYIGGWYSAWKKRSLTWTFRAEDLPDQEAIERKLSACEQDDPAQWLHKLRNESKHKDRPLEFLNEIIERGDLQSRGLSPSDFPDSLRQLYTLDKEGADHSYITRLLIEKTLGDDLVRPNSESPEFPSNQPKTASAAASPPITDQREPTEIRHLREFSRFLIPRLGLFNVDMWNAFSTIISGTIPAMFTALAVLVVTLSGWLLVASPLSRVGTSFWPYWVISFAMIFLLMTELRFIKTVPKRIREESSRSYCYCWLGYSFLLAISLLAGIYSGFFQASFWDGFDTLEFRDTLLPSLSPPQDLEGAPSRAQSTPGSSGSSLAYAFNLKLLAFPAVLWFSQLLLIFCRPMFLKISPQNLRRRRSGKIWFELDQAWERLTGRILALGLAWCSVVALWEVSSWIASNDAIQLMLLPGGTAVTSTTAFVALRRWFLSFNSTDESAEAAGRVNWLKPIIPPLLAYLSLISIGILMMVSLAKLTLSLSSPEAPQKLASYSSMLIVYWVTTITSATVGLCSYRYLSSQRIQTTESKNKEGTAAKARSLKLWESGLFILSICGACAYFMFAHTYLRQEVEGSLSNGDILKLVIFLCFSTAVIAISLAAIFFDTARMGLHEFYRGRISRAFLGASSNKSHISAERRFSSESYSDDFCIRELSGQRPVHLICCAANDQASDMLPNLYRGARSATLSAFGIAMGGSWKKLNDLRISSALTASAAAFNSVMGTKSVQLGKPVSFLLAALNLRLGLWLPAPTSTQTKRDLLPGLNFFREMFVSTRATVTEDTKDTSGSNSNSLVHLSDGGHFENLGLYELVRRHCRYIIVSDVGADPSKVFSDLGNAIRRIREDFGVEIELMLDPLGESNHDTSEQHLVVGTIHYDGPKGIDKGILVYLKPTLTGDEPFDVLQFKNRCPSFPHESTVDQFYDESQWEAYRRLGEHTAREAFSNNDFSGKHKVERSVSALFQQYRDHWYPTPKDFSNSFLQLTARFNEVEADIRRSGSQAIKRQFFHEPIIPDENNPTPKQTSIDDIYILMQVCQLLEDVWLGCKLDEFWSHPLNRGWINYLHRWTGCPCFSERWPIISPLYSIGFRRFMSRRFGLLDVQGEQKQKLMSIQILGRLSPKLSARRQITLNRLLPKHAPLDSTCQKSECEAVLLWKFNEPELNFALGALRIRFRKDDAGQQYVQWDVPAFRCAPGYVDTESRIFFFSQLISKLRNKVQYFEATIKGAKSRSHAQNSPSHSSEELMDRIAVLKRLGFSLQSNSGGIESQTVMKLTPQHRNRQNDSSRLDAGINNKSTQ